MPTSTSTYEIISARSLTPRHIARWNALIPTGGDWAIPFRAEYTCAVAAMRESVDVCIIREGRDTVGFFPFERVDRTVGRPVGGVDVELPGRDRGA